MDFQPLEHDHNLFCFQSWAVCGLLLCKETSAHEDGSVGMWLHTSTLHVCHICLHWGRWHHCDLGFIPRSPLDLLLWWITAAATRSSWALPLTCIGSCSPATLEPKTPVHFIFSLAHPKVQALPRNNHLTPASFFSSLGLEDCLRYLKGPSMDCDLKRLAALRGNMKKRKWWSSCFIPFLVCSPKSFV